MSEPLESVSVKWFRVIETTLNDFAGQSAQTLAPILMQVMNWGVPLLLVVYGFHCLSKGQTVDLWGVGRKLLVAFLCYGILARMSNSWQYLIEPVRQALFFIPSAFFAGHNQFNIPAPITIGANKTVYQFLYTIDLKFNHMMDLIKFAVHHNAGFLGINIGVWIFSLVFGFLFGFLWCVFIAVLSDVFITLSLISALSPLFIACFAFKLTRGIGETVVKIFFAMFLKIFLATLSISLIFFLMDKMDLGFPVNHDGTLDSDKADVFFFSADSWFLVLMCVFGSFLLLKASKFASQLASIDTSVGLEALAGAAGGGLLTFAKATSMKATPMLGKGAWKGSKWGMGKLNGYFN